LIEKSRSILIVGHQNADPDAVCSGYALLTFARRVNKKLDLEFASPEGVSKLSKLLLQTIPMEVNETPDPSKFDAIITVDTNTVQQLGPLREMVVSSGKPLVMIDHHAPHPENAKLAEFVLCDDKSTSTCEMILGLYRANRMKLPAHVSQALLVGMLVETGHLSIGTKRTFEAACALIESGADPQKAMGEIRIPMDESERIARIKSAQRTRVERIGKWLIALSEVGSYHASAARALVSLGAHVAIVAGKRNNELTVSLRCTHDFISETGMHLGTKLANPLGQRFDGMGGGHATAAGASAKGEVQDVLTASVQLIREFLSETRKA